MGRRSQARTPTAMPANFTGQTTPQITAGDVGRTMLGNYLGVPNTPQVFTNPSNPPGDPYVLQRGSSPRQTMGIAQIGAATNKYGMPVTVTPGVEQRIRCPTGYVAVKIPQPDGSQARACMIRAAAVSMGLWSPRKKGPISAKEWSAVKAVGRVQSKLKKITSTANMTPRVVKRRG